MPAPPRLPRLFVVVSAATLMFQLYGFIAVPDGPLMFTAALFLLTFKWFPKTAAGRGCGWASPWR